MNLVIWLSRHVNTPCRGYWDQGFIEALCEGSMWPPAQVEVEHLEAVSIPDGLDSAVVVVPARHHADDVEWLNVELGRLNRVLLILTGDEEGVFPVEQLDHPNLRLWVQTPRRPVHGMPVGDWWPPGTPETLEVLRRFRADLRADPEYRDLDWYFAGQVNNARREECLAVLKQLPNGVAMQTEGFTQGLNQYDYLRWLSRAKVAPCPSGTFTPDTFRVFEALEAGCVPVVDSYAPESPGYDYWHQLFGAVPFPIVKSWSEFPEACEDIVNDWTRVSTEVRAWWIAQKRELALDFAQELAWLSDQKFTYPLTTVVTTSPIISHPDDSILVQTIESIRERLPEHEIILAFDGVREEQASLTQRYQDYTSRVVQRCRSQWSGILPLIANTHVHQANLLRMVLPWVRSDVILFSEHDTPLVGDVPFDEAQDRIRDGTINLLRLHHEASILPEHEHLMLDTPDVGTMLRTMQWSQRPHLASVEFYERILNEYFGRDSRTMIEDVMAGVLEVYWAEKGEEGWKEFRLAIYAPEGDVKRSTHLDGRAGEPKYEFVWTYDGPTPWGAPRPTAERDAELH